MDFGHPRFGWQNADSGLLERVFSFLGSRERSTWGEILAERGGQGPRNGVVPIDAIERKNSAVARDILSCRSAELAGSLMKLRYQKRGRVWGIMEGHVCFLFWLDPNHDVWRDR